MTMESNGDLPPLPGSVRPVGTWVVGGVLAAAILLVWGLVSLIFLHRA
ncbi:MULTISPECIES: hypothetical protein [Nguyenibacter]|uniref:Uncharacterized protein n=1 Tax=Nguyenibacter vanlangensis TaxID=1216886 RepID=A0A7Y7IXS4_9PROT|nr:MULTISPECIES: hypothetical protein [Nguyenibacter]NVN12348.1 hypothetical protein [Nguyenibacter vanlangensis]WRH87247.1 hypothetical protein QN315_14880 [Nguyenibacter sp. L1]